MKYIVSQWEKCYVQYEFIVEADSPEHAVERVAAGEWEECEMGDIDNIGEVDVERVVRELS